MVAIADTVNTAIKDVDDLRSFLKKSKTKQLQGQWERTRVKACANAWFDQHRVGLSATMGDMLKPADELYEEILNASDRATARSTYMSVLKSLRATLIELRSETLTATDAVTQTLDLPPDFSPLITDIQMREILKDRWWECVRCIEADAPLAATVMMGGLLEALLLARFKRETNQPPIYHKAKSAPKKAGEILPLGGWKLRDYISVAHELGWLTTSAKGVAEVLRDFRNYIHPNKELSTHKQHLHGIKKLSKDDTTIFWDITKSISLQLLKSCIP